MKIKHLTLGMHGTKGECRTVVVDGSGGVMVGSKGDLEMVRAFLAPAVKVLPGLPPALESATTEGDIRDVVTSATKAAEPAPAEKPKAAAPAPKKSAPKKAAAKKPAAKKSASRKKSAKKDK